MGQVGSHAKGRNATHAELHLLKLRIRKGSAKSVLVLKHFIAILESNRGQKQSENQGQHALKSLPRVIGIWVGMHQRAHPRVMYKGMDKFACVTLNKLFDAI